MITIIIAGNFRGVQFLWFSWMIRLSAKIKPVKIKLDCTVHNGREWVCLQKLDPQNCKDRPFAKIEPHKNFPLYGNIALKLANCIIIITWTPFVYS